MPNQLIYETSPYLLQHAGNPVDWYPWGAEAFEKARREDKPVLLSIGYAACHWCHVMAHESFENPETARLLNEYFVCIKVDREERPDLDNIYMNAVVSLTGQGGWPLNVFLTPDAQPFYGGTYFPPVRRYGVVSFPEVLVAMVRVWSESRDSAIQAAQNMTHHLQQINLTDNTEMHRISPDTLENAARVLLNTYDYEAGGWGDAPKFPMPMSIEFLLRRAARGDSAAQGIASHVLQMMCKGGMYDVIGGGFHRYSTDANWLIPHFEKMLYDNAQLAPAYLHAWLLTGKPEFRRICEETLAFIEREMTHPLGGFFSSLDADSDGEEGRFYTWTITEIQNALSTETDFELFSSAYHLPPQGNFESRIILQRRVDDASLANTFNLSMDDLLARLQRCHQSLLQARTERNRPPTDDKVLVSWNALTLNAFAEAARYLGNDNYLKTARRNAEFLLTAMRTSGRLQRAWRAGKAHHDAYLEDYAALISALLSLYQSDPDPHWFTAAEELAAEMVIVFSEENGTFYQTRPDGDNILFRPRDIQDNATPSGAALASAALLRLAAYNGRSDWRELAEKAICAIQSRAQQIPIAFSYWLQAADLAINPIRQVALIWQAGDLTHQDFIHALWSRYRPETIYAGSPIPIPEGAPFLLRDKDSYIKDQTATAFICESFTCKQPANSADEFKKQLSH